LTAVRIMDIQNQRESEKSDESKPIALLGFFRVASSIISELQLSNNPMDAELMKKTVVVDFNTNAHHQLNIIGVKAIYGDISHMDTLHHAGIHDAKIVISTIPDTILVGTDNLKIIRQIKNICPHAKIVVTAESPNRALKMYAEGADYVFLPRILAARHVIPIIRELLNDVERAGQFKEEQMEMLKNDKEIIS